MEDNIFLLSDASYSHLTKIAGLGVVDTFSQKKYQLSVNNLDDVLKAEFYALSLSVKIAIKNGYSNVVFVYDCKELNIDTLEEYAKKRITNVQFLWLKRNYLKDADLLARNARKLVERFKIKKASKKELNEMKENALMKEKKDFFISFSTKKKISAIMNIANNREKSILNGFLSSSSISSYSNSPLGSKKATLMKFTYSILEGEDKINFFYYLAYINPNIEKKSFKKGLSVKSIDNYINRIFSKLTKQK